MRGTVLALAAMVAAGTAAYGTLGAHLRGPSVFADELIYMDATRSVAAGHRPIERDRTYGRGPLYPVAAAPVFAAAGNDRDAYRLLKLFNSFLFSLAAVPVFLLARRLLPRAWSLAVAGLAVAAPSALYTGMVLTESVAYATSSLALLAIALALERPTVKRQGAALGCVALATLARPQLGALAFVVPLGLLVGWLARPEGGRPSLQRALRQLWPTGVALVAAALLATIAASTGRATLSDYSDVWTSYDPLSVVKWSWYTLANLALYLAIVPLVVGPAALADAWRRARRGSLRDGSFLGLFLATNVLTILLVAAFSGASFGFERLHDRYLFYVVPLWLILFAVWLERGTRASAKQLAVGGALTLALLATLPARLVERDGAVQFDGVGTAVWSRVQGSHPGALRLVLMLAVLAAVVTAVFAPTISARWLPVMLVVVAAFFAVSAAIVWDARAKDADRHVFADDRPGTWSWVDRALQGRGAVTSVYIDSSCILERRDAYRWTEFFNGRIGPVMRIGLAAPAGVVTDGTDARIGADGIVSTLDGKPLRPHYVVTSPAVRPAGRPVARGTKVGLRLWRTSQPLRFLGVHSNAQAIRADCKGSGP